MKNNTLFLYSILFAIFLLSGNLFPQSHPSPSAENILNHPGYADEFGVYNSSPYATFTVKIDNKPAISNTTYGGYSYISFETGNDGASAASPYFNITPNQWHRVEITISSVTNVVWIYPPTNADLNGISADFVINTDGTAYDKVWSDEYGYPWSTIRSTSCQTPPIVGIEGPNTAQSKSTVTYYSYVSNIYNTPSYDWEMNTGYGWGDFYPNNTADITFMMPFTDVDLRLTVTSGSCISATSYFHITNGVILIEKKNSNTLPTFTKLYPNYPNPFNPTTLIRYDIKDAGLVNLKVYNTLGEEVATLVNENKPAGRYTVNFDASKLASGVYLYKLVTNNYVKSEKMILMK